MAIGQTGNTSEFSATVQTQARVELNLSGSGSSHSVYPGDDLTYNFTITNTGTNPATQVVFTDVLDPNTTFEPATSTTGITTSGNTLTYNVGTLQPGTLGHGDDHRPGRPRKSWGVQPLEPGELHDLRLQRPGGDHPGDGDYLGPALGRSGDHQRDPVGDDELPDGDGDLHDHRRQQRAVGFERRDDRGHDPWPDERLRDLRLVRATGDPDSRRRGDLHPGTLQSRRRQTFTVTVSPTDQAVNQALRNSATITSSDIDHDPNHANNTLASGPVNVIPAVTLVASLSGSADPVQVGDPLTYTATVGTLGCGCNRHHAD